MARDPSVLMRAEMVRTLRAVNTSLVSEFGMALCQAISQGRAIYVLGNGGSAATAAHIEVDLVQICQEVDSTRVCLVKSLSVDAATLTGLANDYGYESVFRRQLQGVVKKSDVVIAISSSGRSPNVLDAASLARQSGAMVLGLTGKSGDQLKELCRFCFAADSDDKYVVEPVHLCFTHLVAARVRSRLLRGER